MERLDEHLDVLAILRGAIDPANWFHQEALARVIDLLGAADVMVEVLQESLTVSHGVRTVFGKAVDAMDGERRP